MDKRRELIEAYWEFLAHFCWQWFVTLTFRGYAGSSRAKRLFDKWMHELQVKAGGPEFRWFRVMEKGETKRNIHFHVLIGGLAKATEQARWAHRWNALAGDARIDAYDPERHAIFYMLKELELDQDFDFETNLDASLIQKCWRGD